jgi:O-antigen ligase
MLRVEPSPPATRWDWARSVLLTINLVWTTLCLGGYRPETMVVTLCLTGLLLAVHLLALCAEGRSPHPAGLALVPFLIYALGNVLWITPVKWLGWADWIAWTNFAAVFAVALHVAGRRGPGRFIFFVLIGLALTGAGLACYQRFLDPKWLMLGRTQVTEFHGRASGFFGIPNSLAAFLLLLLPSTLWLAARRGASSVQRVGWGWVAAVIFVGFVLTISRGGWLELGVSLAAWPLFGERGRWPRRLAYSAIALVLTVVLAGIVISSVPKARERFVRLVNQSGERSRPIMWRAAWELFKSAPALGTGAGSYNVLFERHRPEQFLDEPQWAHNEYLNTLSDYGFVGAGLGLGAVLWVGVRTHRRRVPAPPRWWGEWTAEPGLANALAAGLVAFTVQIGFDFHLRLPALAMTAATLAAWVVAERWPVPEAAKAPDGARRGFFLSAAIAVVIAVLVAVLRGWGEALRYQARQEIDQLAVAAIAPPELSQRLQQIYPKLERAVKLAPGNGQAWADLAYAAALRPLGEPERREAWARIAESAADRALARSSVNPEFWVRRGVARDLQGRWLEAGGDFSRATELAPRNAWMWYYQAEHLSRRPNAHGLRDAALAFCLRLDPGNSAGLALRQRLAISQSAP